MTHLLYRSDCLQDAADQESDTVADVPFMLLSRKETVAGYGVRARVSVVADTSQGDQASAFFARRQGGPPLLFGAVPFDLGKPSVLIQPAMVLKSPRRLDPASVTPLMALPDAIAPAARRWDVDPHPQADRYASSVAECLSRMARSEGGPEPLRKVVLCRDPHGDPGGSAAGDSRLQRHGPSRRRDHAHGVDRGHHDARARGVGGHLRGGGADLS